MTPSARKCNTLTVIKEISPKRYSAVNHSARECSLESETLSIKYASDMTGNSTTTWNKCLQETDMCSYMIVSRISRCSSGA